jgi:hypothetical protein
MLAQVDLPLGFVPTQLGIHLINVDANNPTVKAFEKCRQRKGMRPQAHALPTSEFL